MDVVLLDAGGVFALWEHFTDDRDGIAVASQVHFASRVAVEDQHMHD